MRKIKNKFAQLFRFLFGRKPKNFKQIPIIINNYNRLTTTTQLIAALENRGYSNIHILDNQSTYPPLLEYYKTTPYKVHHLKKNYGSKALWKSGIWYQFITSNFVYTDSDVVPIEDCPENFLEHFYKLLKKYPKAHKVGFSLKLDDIPDSFQNKNKVIEWESRYYKDEIEKGTYIAAIDTTFALYKPFSKAGQRDHRTLVFRTDAPYQARHMPWYIDNNNLDEEETYYLNSLQTRTHWSRQNKE